MHTGNADYVAQDFARYAGATSQGVHDVAKKYLDLDNFVRIDFVPKGSKKPTAPATRRKPQPGGPAAKAVTR